MLYSGSDEQTKLKAIQTYLRYLSNKIGSQQEMELGTSLPMLAHIDEVQSQLTYLRSAVQRAAYVEMVEKNVNEIETSDFVATLINKPSVTKVRSQEVAEALLAKIQETEVRRNKKLPEAVVRSIVATTFWSLIESLSVKWSKTKLKKRGILLEDYSDPGSPQNKVEVVSKH